MNDTVILIDLDEIDVQSGPQTQQKKSVNPIQLFKFSPIWLKALLFFGLLFAVGYGILEPIFTIFLGNAINAFKMPDLDSLIDNASGEDTQSLIDKFLSVYDKDEVIKMVRILLILSGISFTIMFGMGTLMRLTAQINTVRIRHKYIRSVVSQEMEWYDSSKTGEITERFGGDLEKIQIGCGMKLGMVITAFSQFISGWVIGFVKGWKLTLVVLSIVPILGVSGMVVGILLRNITKQTQTKLAQAGGVAEEVIVSMRTVTSLNCQEFSAKRYERFLEEAYKFGVRKAYTQGIITAIMMSFTFGIFALGFWFGAKLVRESEMNAGLVMTVFMAVLMGTQAIMLAFQNFQVLGEACGAAYKIFETIERKSQINPFDQDGEFVEFRGEVKFDNVKFFYPSRASVQVLKGVSFSVNPSETLALVGPSGCGKSTTVSLIERFYERSDGNITIDGIPLEDINISCLREQIGIVGQEPVLFAMTIMENIKLGSKAEVTDEQVYEACKMANIYDFIMNLKDQFDTMVGERGVQLSGGQKQRIAIARALIKNPKILILDEATSALDTESEGIVQKALENASKGRTTIMIAHRLSTIRNVSQIIVIDKGIIKERGNHNELMEKKGLYYSLVNKQQIKRVKSKEERQNKTLSESKHKSRQSPEKVDMKDDIIPQIDSESDDEKDSFHDETQHHPFPTNKKSPLFRVLPFAIKNKFYLFIGTFGAFCAGAVLPCFAIVMARFVTNLLQSGSKVSPEFLDEKRKDADVLSLMILVIMVGSGLSFFFETVGLQINGERMMKDIRTTMFRLLLKQNIGFFDSKSNSTGILMTRLATDAQLIDSAIGTRIGLTFQIVSALIAALVIAFFGSWIISLVVIGCAPFLGVALFFNVRFINTTEERLKAAYEISNHLATEAVENIRTVAMLNQEQFFINIFKRAIVPANNRAIKNAFVSAFSSGMTGFLQFGVSALAFYLTTLIIDNEKGNFEGILQTMMALMFAMLQITQVSAIQTDFSKAVLAAKHFCVLKDRNPRIDSECKEGLKKRIIGKIEFDGIEFVYPSRKTATVLRDFNLKIPAGTSMALVGPSGCGKSTTVGMVERFYDPKEGKVLIDGSNIKDYNIRTLRSQIGLVSQEPILFGTTIRENIKMGAVDREVSDEEIIAACKKANAHKFIMSFPEGYETQTGEKGVQLSGGQKQRIAIARSLIADPKILILDEATSALDTESERIVQQALDKAAEGRTTIMIAHRLSTVQKADCIAVIKKGKVVEMGTHAELIADQKTEYYRLAKKQLKHEIPVQ